MLRKTIPLLGQTKALLRLQTEGGATACALSPPLEAGALYLIGPQGQAQALALDAEGNAAARLAFEPQAALVYDGAGFPLAGGFAGQAALLEKARLAVRLLAAAAPPAPVPPAEAAPQPEAEAQAAPGAQERPAAPEAQAPEPEPAAAPPPPRSQSAALLEILQKAQELFHPEPGAAPAPPQAPEPAAIANPFPRAFPRSRWQRVEYPGAAGHYLTGEGTGRNGPYTVYALPGEYAPVPRQRGFNRFLRAPDGQGYWLHIVWQ